VDHARVEPSRFSKRLRVEFINCMHFADSVARMDMQGLCRKPSGAVRHCDETEQLPWEIQVSKRTYNVLSTYAVSKPDVSSK
jgi:hypothetical protein